MLLASSEEEDQEADGAKADMRTRDATTANKYADNSQRSTKRNAIDRNSPDQNLQRSSSEEQNVPQLERRNSDESEIAEGHAKERDLETTDSLEKPGVRSAFGDNSNHRKKLPSAGPFKQLSDYMSCSSSGEKSSSQVPYIKIA